MNNYPIVPYAIRLQTQLAVIWMIWEYTAWDTPAQVSYECDLPPAVDLAREFFKTHNIGFQGYPVENIDRPSPMDMYDILCKHTGGFIQDFDVMGLIPDDPPSSPEKDIEPDDEEYDDEETKDVKPVLESSKIRVPYLLEETGEVVYIETDAHELEKEIEQESSLYESILNRMES